MLIIALSILGAFAFGVIATLRLLWHAGSALRVHNRRRVITSTVGAAAVERWKRNGESGSGNDYPRAETSQ